MPKPDTSILGRAKAIIAKYEQLIDKAKAISDKELREMTVAVVQQKAESELRALFPVQYQIMNTGTSWINRAA